MSGELITLDFIALSKIREENYDLLLKDLKKALTWDELFLPFPQREMPSMEDLLASQNALPYWDRTSHSVVLSDLVEGRLQGDIKGRYYRDSLNLSLKSSPLEEVEVHLHAKWVQRFEGATRLDRLLQKDLPEGVIQTYSGFDLEKQWWQADQQFRPHGYRVADTSLVSFPKLERIDGFWVSPDDPLLQKKRIKGRLQAKDPKKVRFKRKAYRPSLKLGWRYVQPRHEEVVFKLKQDFQTLSYKPSKRKILNLTVYDLIAREQLAHWGADLYYKREEQIDHQGSIYQARRSHRSSARFIDDTDEWENLGPSKTYPLQQHRGTFFKTDRGRKVVEQALDCAKAYLCSSSRCVDISFICPLEEALKWTCDHSITMTDERLPGGKAKGKIKKLTLEVIGETGRMRAYVTLGCCVGTGKEALVEDANSSEAYGMVGVLEESLPSQYIKTEGGVFYRYGDSEGAERGILYPAFLGAGDLLREVTISHDAKQQEENLQANQYPNSHNILEEFKGNGTKVQLRLEDLRGRRLEKTTLSLEILNPWSAPKHINLGGN
ncbi:MAG TPA: hypothetical protein DD412_06570 [Holosporales bacterium]|nr:hypothetical protein [Holosporales bacterium]